jgi:tetratricopeptide (TPR) repeat protein
LADEQRSQGPARDPGVRDRYQLVDRTGHTAGEMSVAAVTGLIRQGRLFRSDKVVKNGGEIQRLDRLAELLDIFDELMPPGLRVSGDALHALPALSGDFDPLGFADLLTQLYQEKRTGRLFVFDTRSENARVLIFRAGQVISAMSDAEDEWLGKLLLSQGIIDEPAYRQAVELRKLNGSRLGSALVYLEKLSSRQLRRALSVQAMERLLNVFRVRDGRFNFVDDDTAGAEEILLVASTRDIIETGLSAAMGAREVADIMAGYGDPVFRVAFDPDRAGDLSDSDRKVLEIIRRGTPLSGLLDGVAKAARLTNAEARLRIMTLMKFGILEVGGAEVGALEENLRKIQRHDFFRMLDLRRAATADDVVAGHGKKTKEYAAAARSSDTKAVARLRGKIRARLDQARDTLLDEDGRPIYERALQLGLDYHQPEIKRRLRHERLTQKARGFLAKNEPAQALVALLETVKLMPDDPQGWVDIGWARFLDSERDEEAAAGSILDIQRALKMAGDLDSAYLTMGKIYRLAGDLPKAEKNLRKALSLNPRNNEAQSQLRLLFSRELDRGGMPKIEFKMAGGVAPVLLTAGVVIGALFACANIVPGGPEVWPEVQAGQSAEKDRRINPRLRQMFEAARDRLKEEVDYKIPLDEQVLGNVEGYFLVDDSWFWVRRAVLLILGLLGILFINKESIDEFPWAGERPGWIMAAIPYGLVVGFFSPTLATPTGLGALLGMSAFQVLAEQVFFFWFVGRGLLKTIDHPIGAGVLMAVVFGLYQLTFCAIFSLSGVDTILGVLQVTCFAGGAYAFLLIKSGGVIAPLIAHLVINSVMIISSVLALS